MTVDPMPPVSAPERTPPRRSLQTVFTTVLLLSVGCAGFLTYLFYAEGKKPESPPAPAIPSKIIQLDVLNGCGAKGAGAKFTTFLRGSGFDVVELKNYSSSTVARTLVIDRSAIRRRATGCRRARRRVERRPATQPGLLRRCLGGHRRGPIDHLPGKYVDRSHSRKENSRVRIVQESLGRTAARSQESLRRGRFLRLCSADSDVR